MEILKAQLHDFCSSEHCLEGERVVALKMLAYLDQKGASSLNRVTRPAHFTASGLVLSCDQKKVLLIEHKKLQKWLQPGGHADNDAHLLNVAIREVFEETGVATTPLSLEIFSVDWHKIPTTLRESEHEHADCAFCLVAKNDQIVQNLEETCSAGWFEPQEALELVQDPSVRRMIEKFFYGS